MFRRQRWSVWHLIMNKWQKLIEPKVNTILFLAAFVAYLGFLNVLVAHSHPVMLVFCHLLINRNNDRELEESLPHIESSVASREQKDREGMLWFCHLFVVEWPSIQELLKQEMEGWLPPFHPMSSVSLFEWNSIRVKRLYKTNQTKKDYNARNSL